MRLVDFLRSEIGLRSHELDILDALGGQEVSGLTFCSTVDEARDRIEPDTPVFVLPFARSGGYAYGLHLRPSDRDSQTLRVVRGCGSNQCKGVGDSLRAVVYRQIAVQEYRIQDSPARARTLAPSVALANRLFGDGFYEPGRDVPTDEVALEETLIRRGFGSVVSYAVLALVEEGEHPEQYLAVLQRARAEYPDWLCFHSELAQAFYKRGQVSEAASSVRAGLSCYHHTLSRGNSAFTNRAQDLVKAAPSAFTSDEADEIQSFWDDAKTADRVKRLTQAQRYEDLQRLLCNLGHQFEDYGPILNSLRMVYEDLGWSWAIALCDLRGKGA